MIKYSVFLLYSVNTSAICTLEALKDELREDIAFNGKLNCLRRAPNPLKDNESDDEKNRRLLAIWNSDCAFEMTYNWAEDLRHYYGLKDK